MTQHIDVYETNGTISLPANLISSTLLVTAVGGGTFFSGVSPYIAPGPFNGAYISAQVPKALFPLTIVIGQNPTDGNGANGYSGGGAAPEGSNPSNYPTGGAGSTAVLSSGSLLLEAGGASGLANFSVGGGLDPGGSGGGYASFTPVILGPLYGNPDPTDAGAGSGGSQGGNGGNSWSGSGGVGAGGGTNGNDASGTVSGAGVGSGGLAVANLGSSFAASTVSGAQYGQASSNTGAVAVTYNVADTPDIARLVSPANGAYADTNADGVTFTGTYETIGPDTGALAAVAVLLKTDGGANHYWNGTDFSSTSPVFVTPDSGVGATGGENFSVVIPPGVLADGHTYTWGLACQESFANLDGAFYFVYTLHGQVAPTLVFTAPASTVTTLTPTVSWTPTTPAGSQTAYDLKIYSAPSDPTLDTPLVEYTGTTATSQAVGSGILHSVDTYYAYLQITETGGQTSAWAEVVFTVQLVDSATPTLTAVPVAEPSTGCPSGLLTGTTSGGTASPSIRFQSSTDGVTWTDVIGLGPINDIATSLVAVSGGSASIYDMGVPMNASVQYRCRNEAISGGETYVSAWSNVVTITVASDYWWLVVPSDLSMSMQLNRLKATTIGTTTAASSTGASVTTPAMPNGIQPTIITDEQEMMGRFNGFGRSTAVVIHSDIWTEEFVLSTYFDNDAAFQAFRAVRALRKVQLLKWDMMGELSWVNFGPARPAGILAETQRRKSPRRGMSIQCIPADPVLT